MSHHVGAAGGLLSAEAARLVEALALVPHPEGGFYRETYRGKLVKDGRNVSTAIYFLLPAGTFSALHRVRSDEVWHHYQGDSIDLHTIEEGVHTVTRLGQDVAAGECPQLVVPAGAWQAAMPCASRAGYALCGCTVAPGFDFRDFEMPSRADLLASLPEHADLIAALGRLPKAGESKKVGGLK